MSWVLNKIIITPIDGGMVNWRQMSQSGVVFVEIGFGNGEFLEYLGRTFPDVLIVGAEVSQWCAAKGARRVAAAGLDNVRIVHGDARFLLRRSFEPETISKVYMNYPCPWPKARHASRRVTVPLFADLLNYLLVLGGVFELATDVGWYAEECANVMKRSRAFDAEPVVVNPKRPYVTKYERKWKTMGKDTWLFTACKNGAVKAGINGEVNFPMEAETESNKTAATIISELKDKNGSGTDGTGRWVFREGFVSADGVGLILTITADEGFEQHFYLKVIPKGTGYTIKVDSVGHPYRTPAMKAALRYAIKTAEGV